MADRLQVAESHVLMPLCLDDKARPMAAPPFSERRNVSTLV